MCEAFHFNLYYLFQRIRRTDGRLKIKNAGAPRGAAVLRLDPFLPAQNLRDLRGASLLI
jgi:hypothetical protein